MYKQLWLNDFPMISTSWNAFVTLDQCKRNAEQQDHCTKHLLGLYCMDDSSKSTVKLLFFIFGVDVVP